MRTEADAIAKVLAAINEDEAVQLVRDLVDIPSPTGYERDVAEFIAGWFEANDFSALRQPVEADRFNAVGRLAGVGGGASLMFNGHMDTNLFGLREELVNLPQCPPDVVRAEIRRLTPPSFVQDGKVYGYQIVNMKGCIAAFLTAMKAIQRSGIKLRGDLVGACVVGEVGAAAVDEYQGSVYHSKGHGTRYLLRHGVTSDYAICADTSEFGITWIECGVVYLKLTTRGKTMYTPFTQRPKNRAESDNAVCRMVAMIDVVEEWAQGYEARNRVMTGVGPIQPKVNIGAIRGGAPYRAAVSPSFCHLYVDVRVRPNQDPHQVIEEFTAMVRGCGVPCEVTPFVSQWGYEAVGAEPVVDSLRQSYQHVYGEPAPQIPVPFTSMWSDTNCFSEVGIPCAKFGPAPRQNVPAQGTEHRAWIRDFLAIEDIVGAAKVYALAAIEICNGPRPSGR